jgi:hypothetical protein
VAAVDRLASDPRRLALVFGLSVAGHLAVASTLWVALAGLGFDARVAVVLLVIPLAKLAGFAPTPGGFGSAEAMLAALLLAVTVSLAVTTLVVIHRSRLLVEPDSILVHAVRDSAVVLVSFVPTWILLRRLPRQWLG